MTKSNLVKQKVKQKIIQKGNLAKQNKPYCVLKKKMENQPKFANQHIAFGRRVSQKQRPTLLLKTRTGTPPAKKATYV